jgi:hypothetical protein
MAVKVDRLVRAQQFLTDDGKTSMRTLTLALSFFLLTTLHIDAQPASDQKSNPEEAALNLYTKAQARTSRLFNGREYIAYTPLKDEHPYLTVDWEEGSVMYDGQLYRHIALLYDVSIDQLITKYYNDADILLIREKVSFFTMDKRKFISVSDGVTTPGFHELLYDGKIKVLSKFEKKFMEKVSGVELQREFEEKTRWYISMNGKYFTVKNKKSVQHLFPEHQTELKKFIRDRNLSFKKTVSSDLVAVAIFCEKFL